MPDLGGSSRLPQVVGVGRAKELIMTGRVIGAADAERFGLANRVAADDLDGGRRTSSSAELLGCAPIAVGLAKRLIDASARPALSTTLGARGHRPGAVRALRGRPARACAPRPSGARRTSPDVESNPGGATPDAIGATLRHVPTTSPRYTVTDTGHIAEMLGRRGAPVA